MMLNFSPSLSNSRIRGLIEAVDYIPFLELSNPKKVMRSRVVSIVDLENEVRSALEDKRPLLVTRYGTAEGELIRAELTNGLENDFRRLPHLRTQLWTHAGIFPPEVATYKSTSSILIDAYSKADIIGVRFQEPYYWRLETFLNLIVSPNAKLVDISSVFPCEDLNFWHASLKERKILVVHPFNTSIEKQISFFRENSSSNSFWNKTDFNILQAVQSISADKSSFQFSNWDHALESMKEKMEKIDFEIALIGCGAYGAALASHAKTLGKVALHIGGALQLFFKISGTRWVDNKSIVPISANGWIRPSADETPSQYLKHEGGAYW